MRGEWGPRGVRVTTIEPGLTAAPSCATTSAPDLQEELDGMFEPIARLAQLRRTSANVIALHRPSRPAHVNLARVELVPTAQA